MLKPILGFALLLTLSTVVHARNEKVIARCGYTFHPATVIGTTNEGKFVLQFESDIMNNVCGKSAFMEYQEAPTWSAPSFDTVKPVDVLTVGNIWQTTYRVGDLVEFYCGDHTRDNLQVGTVSALSSTGFVNIEPKDVDSIGSCKGWYPIEEMP